VTAKACVTGSAACGRSSRRRRCQQAGNLERETGINALGAQSGVRYAERWTHGPAIIGNMHWLMTPSRSRINVSPHDLMMPREPAHEDAATE
jgi:hypothetical protein